MLQDQETSLLQKLLKVLFLKLLFPTDSSDVVYNLTLLIFIITIIPYFSEKSNTFLLNF